MPPANDRISYGSGRTQHTDSIDPAEARDALAAIDAVRSRVPRAARDERKWIPLLAVLIGLASFALLQRSLWGFLIPLILLVAFGLRSFRTVKPVRVALKQEVRPDEFALTWKGLVPMFVMYSAAVVLPLGNTAVSAMFGLGMTVAVLAAHHYSEKQKP